MITNFFIKSSLVFIRSQSTGQSRNPKKIQAFSRSKLGRCKKFSIHQHHLQHHDPTASCRQKEREVRHPHGCSPKWCRLESGVRSLYWYCSSIQMLLNQNVCRWRALLHLLPSSMDLWGLWGLCYLLSLYNRNTYSDTTTRQMALLSLFESMEKDCRRSWVEQRA